MCSPGYTGVLCGTCSDNYFFDSETSTCEICEGANIWSTSFILILIALFLLVLGYCVRLYYAHMRVNEATVHQEHKIEEQGEKSVNWWADWLEERSAPLMVSLKIMMSTYQIVSSVGSVLQIDMPVNFSKFMDGFKIFSFSVVQILPFSCVYKTDFVDSLIFTTVWPMICGGLLFVVCVSETFYKRRCKRRKAESEPDKEKSSKLRQNLKFEYVVVSRKMKQKYFTLFLLLIYCVLPSVTTTIFAMFPCVDVDPEKVDGLDDYYLRADTAISCTSDRFNFGVAYALVMMFVYPIGVTSWFFILLYKKKDALSKRENSGQQLPPGVEILSFLYKSYKPSCWYFEVSII